MNAGVDYLIQQVSTVHDCCVRRPCLPAVWSRRAIAVAGRRWIHCQEVGAGLAVWCATLSSPFPPYPLLPTHCLPHGLPPYAGSRHPILSETAASVVTLASQRERERECRDVASPPYKHLSTESARITVDVSVYIAGIKSFSCLLKSVSWQYSILNWLVHHTMCVATFVFGLTFTEAGRVRLLGILLHTGRHRSIPVLQVMKCVETRNPFGFDALNMYAMVMQGGWILYWQRRRVTHLAVPVPRCPSGPLLRPETRPCQFTGKT